MATLSTCPDARMLERFLLGQVSAVDAVPLEAHVAACARCVAVLQQVRAEDPLVEALRNTPPPAPQENTELVQALIPGLKRLRPDLSKPTLSEETRPNEAYAAAPEFNFLAPAQAEDELGRLGSYRVLKLLGAGGMGVVFLADDPLLKRRIALKVIKPELVKRHKVHERFLREAQAVAKVEHENIVSIFQVAEDRGVPYLAMPLLRGESLEERLIRANGPLPLDETLRLAREIAAGLAAAHDHGLVHRDIKPGNIFLATVRSPSSAADSVTLNLSEPSLLCAGPDSAVDDGRRATESGLSKVKILDFGLARVVENVEDKESQPGQIMGTPAYMAPEQGRGQKVDHRADLFSLGCVLYRMTTGKAAFRGTDFVSLLLSVAVDTPTPVRQLNPQVPPALARLIEQLLAKKPEDRPQSAHAVVKALEAIERERATVRQPKLLWFGLLAATATALFITVALGTSLAWWLLRTPTPPPEKPGEVTFAVDEPDLKLVVRRGDDAEKVLDLKQSAKHSLPPGAYRMWPAVAQEGRQLQPDEFVVQAGEAQNIELRLVGQIAKWGGFSRSVTGVAVAPRKDVLTILASSLDGSCPLVVWDGKADAQFPSPPSGEKLYPPMYCVAAAPDGFQAATAGGARQNTDARIYLWDISQQKPKLLDRLAGHPVFVKAVAYSPDGSRLISGDSQGNVYIWDLKQRQQLFSLKGHIDEVVSVAFSPDGKRALSGGGNLAILWNAETGKEIKRQEFRKEPEPRGQIKVLAVAFAPVDTEAALVRSDNLVWIWKLESMQAYRQGFGHIGGSVKCLAVSPNGQRILTGSDRGTLNLENLSMGNMLFNSTAGGAISGVAFTPDGRRAVSGGSDGTIRLWELPK